MFAKYSDNVFCSGDVLIAEKRRWGHRRYSRGRHCILRVSLKQPWFRGTERLRFLCDALMRLAAEYDWNLQAWAVFATHYHFVALSPARPENLRDFIKKLHSDSALAVNQWDGTKVRQVWFQYWETRLTYAKSYFARLSYVHRNAVHHKLVREPSLYPWCSASWFQRRADDVFLQDHHEVRDRTA